MNKTLRLVSTSRMMWLTSKQNLSGLSFQSRFFYSASLLSHYICIIECRNDHIWISDMCNYSRNKIECVTEETI